MHLVEDLPKCDACKTVVAYLCRDNLGRAADPKLKTIGAPTGDHTIK